MIRGIRARYILGFQDNRHALLEDGEIVVENGDLLHVGHGYQGQVDEWWDLGNSLVTPGFINLHTHPISTPINRSLREEERGPGKYFGLPFWIRLYDLMTPEIESVLSRYAAWELVRKGTTTALLMTSTYPEMVAESAETIGLRSYISPSYREASWLNDGPYRKRYQWDAERGKEGLERTLRFLERHDGSANGRIRGLFGPEQVDTCSPELLRETARLADSAGVGVTVHASQSDVEYEYILEQHGKTPIELLDHTGLLGERLIIAHCIHLSHHSSTKRQQSNKDLELLAGTGTNVAHCPWCFARRGVVMESLARYARQGVNVGIGTDVAPQDIIQEMRWAAVLSRVVESDTPSPSSQEALAHVTTAGAKALGRADLGKLEAGSKADLLIFDLDQLDLGPVRDPVRTLMYSIDGHNVTSVMIDGNIVVKDGRVLTVDEEQLRRDIQEVSERVWRDIPRIADGKTVDEITPMMFPEFRR